MWHTSFFERELIDFWQDRAGRKRHKPKPKPVSSIAETANDRVIHAYWQNEPGGEFFFPNLLVGPARHFESLFAKLNAVPGKHAPLSACSRIVLLSELDSFSSPPLAWAELPLAGAIALAIAEATLSNVDQTPSREVTAAACKRTLAYAWSLALIRGIDPASLADVKNRWAEVTELLNPSATQKNLDSGWLTQFKALIIQSSLMTGHSSSDPAMTLATLLKKGSSAQVDEWWEQYAGPHGIDISFQRLISSSPLELDNYLKHAMAHVHEWREWSESPAPALCALIATIAAPRSLDYLEHLQRSKDPGIASLYALYAALQWPDHILSGRGSLGYRILRDLTRNEDPWAPPTADIAYIELKALGKPEIEVFLKRFDPASDVTVELMPNLTLNFEPMSREVSSSGDIQEEPRASTRIGREHLDKVEQAIELLTQLVNDSAGEAIRCRDSLPNGV